MSALTKLATKLRAKYSQQPQNQLPITNQQSQLIPGLGGLIDVHEAILGKSSNFRLHMTYPELWGLYQQVHNSTLTPEAIDKIRKDIEYDYLAIKSALNDN